MPDMRFTRSQKFKDIAGFLAALAMAVACLVAALYHINVLVELQRYGEPADATVVNFERGARNSKWAIYRYQTGNGLTVTARDAFQQYIRRVRRGETVRVIYHRDDVETVTADLGLWTWQAPAIFLAGWLLLSVFAFFIWRQRST